jgi:type III secretion protein Q
VSMTVAITPPPCCPQVTDMQPMRAQSITRAEARLANIWYRRWRPVEINLAGLRLIIAPHSGDHPSNRPTVAMALTVDNTWAELLVPVELVDRLLNAVGVRSFSELSERSALLVLELVATPAIEEIERHCAMPIAFTGARIVAPIDFVGGLALDCVIGNRTFTVRFAASRQNSWRHRLVDAMPRLTASVDVPRIPIEAAFRIGTSKIPVGVLRGLSAGDVIIVDCSGFQHGIVALVIGDRRLAFVELRESAATLVTAPFHILGAIHQDWTRTEPMQPHNDDTDTADGEFDDVQVKLLFDIGRLEMSLGELRTLAPGYIFDLGRNPGRAVEILASSRRIGYGEVVQIGDTLGVRVVRLFNDE